MDYITYNNLVQEEKRYEHSVQATHGSYGLIEIKLGGDKLIEEGAETLKAVRDKIDTTKMKNPSFLMVLTGNSPFAYRRNDGVYVVPIGCLRQ